MTNTEQYKFTEDIIEVANLGTDLRVQRPLNMAKVNKILHSFNPSGMGVVSVSKRDAVTFIIIDGQHRVEALRRHTDNGVVLCHVYEGLTIEQEAELFLLLNNTTKPRSIDKFMVEVTSGHPEAVAIDNLVRARQYRISHIAGPATINAINSLRAIYKLSVEKEADPDLISMSLLVVNRAWGIQESASRGVILEGIAQLYGEYGSRVDTETLIRKLMEFPGGPHGLWDQAHTYSKLDRSRMPMAVAKTIVAEYNKGRRVNTLEPWRRTH